MNMCRNRVASISIEEINKNTNTLLISQQALPDLVSAHPLVFPGADSIPAAKH